MKARVSKRVIYSFLALETINYVLIGVSIAGTVRRFLEHYGSSLDTIVFAIDELVDWGIYQVLMPLYFPRSKMEEEAARWQLPPDIGGNDGEPIMPDRQIRIIDNPQHTLHRKLVYASALIETQKRLHNNSPPASNFSLHFVCLS